jgi:hypothetical protein
MPNNVSGRIQEKERFHDYHPYSTKNNLPFSSLSSQVLEEASVIHEHF